MKIRASMENNLFVNITIFIKKKLLFYTISAGAYSTSGIFTFKIIFITFVANFII